MYVYYRRFGLGLPGFSREPSATANVSSEGIPAETRSRQKSRLSSSSVAVQTVPLESPARPSSGLRYVLEYYSPCRHNVTVFKNSELVILFSFIHLLLVERVIFLFLETAPRL